MRNDFIFENLRVYQRALFLSIELIKIAVKFPVIYSRLRDQLIGAAISVPLNLAEGSGRLTTKDKINFYKNSRASSFELIPILDICDKLNLITNKDLLKFRDEIIEISKIISTLMDNKK